MLKYPKEFLEQIASITNKRAKIVIEHIIKHGFITTEDLETIYGYSHPPRAARDVRESGIPLETFKTKSKAGKSIAAYRFGDLNQLQKSRVEGRVAFSKEFKKQLCERFDGHCSICNAIFEDRYLQIDHRIPYQIGGDVYSERKISDFMLLCSSCNRAKSWSCEHCDNWREDKDFKICLSCYWGVPENYIHIAGKEMRRMDLQWSGEEVKYYDAIKLIAERNDIELPEFVKDIIAERTKIEKSRI
ncbi:MAG: HNH endonuclease [Rikenellaceae bacterium]|nr:HNH endonuclease [Rikenellaceae bacterium]MCL2692222.1 HNH endonuclease [Rikenellaceae bacterium]